MVDGDGPMSVFSVLRVFWTISEISVTSLKLTVGLKLSGVVFNMPAPFETVTQIMYCNGAEKSQGSWWYFFRACLVMAQLLEDSSFCEEFIQQCPAAVEVLNLVAQECSPGQHITSFDHLRFLEYSIDAFQYHCKLLAAACLTDSFHPV